MCLLPRRSRTCQHGVQPTDITVPFKVGSGLFIKLKGFLCHCVLQWRSPADESMPSLLNLQCQGKTHHILSCERESVVYLEWDAIKCYMEKQHTVQWNYCFLRHKKNIFFNKLVLYRESET